MKKKKKKKSIFKTLMKGVALVLLIAVLGAGVYINYMLGKLNIDDPFDPNKTGGFIGKGTAEPIDFDPSVFEGDYKFFLDAPEFEQSPASDNQIINILLVGADSRNKNDQGRSDSMMIATLDMRHKKIKLTSLLRDTYVYIPGTDPNGTEYKHGKLNSAYSYGDVELLLHTINANYNMRLSKYVIVNFTLFDKIINILGGIDIRLSDEEYKHLNDRAECGPERKNLKPGVNTLNGTIALEYARLRYVRWYPFDNNGNIIKEGGLSDDYGRTARQRLVLSTIYEELKNESFDKLLGIIESCLEETRTNLQPNEIIGLLSNYMTLGSPGIEQQQIPYSGSFSDKDKRFIIADMPKNAQKLREFIFEQ